MKAVNMLMMGNSDIGFGDLYNWYAIADANFAPTDWRVAVLSDYQGLYSYMDINGYGSKEDGLTHWDSPNTNGTGVTGFNAFGSGCRLPDGTFQQLKTHGYFWSYFDIYDPWAYYLINTGAQFIASIFDAKYGFSVRLVYEGVGTPATVTDYDGRVYQTVLIDGIYWTKSNWRSSHYNNGVVIPTVSDNTAWAALTTGAKCSYV